jgi:membrane associated rhomboid family serine protease
MFFFGKRTLGDVFSPITEIFEFIVSARLTFILILLNVIVFVMQIVFSDFFSGLISYPSDLFSSRFYTIFTAGFMHADIFHLLGNCLALLIFGRIVEMELEEGKMLFIYFGALIISGIFSSVINLFLLGNNIPGLGASGAVMGLVAAAILVRPFYITYELLVPLPVMVVGWATIFADIMGFLSPVADGIGHLAHIGGFVSVMLTMYIAGDKQELFHGLMINIGCLVLAGAVYFTFF